MFVGENAALDFLNSIVEPRDTEFEWPEAGPNLLNWLVQAGLCLEAEIAHLRTSAYRTNLDKAAQSARMFREEFRDFIKTASETSHISTEHPLITKINHMLAQGTQRLKIEIEPGHITDPPHPVKPVNLTSVHSYQSPKNLLPRPVQI